MLPPRFANLVASPAFLAAFIALSALTLSKALLPELKSYPPALTTELSDVPSILLTAPIPVSNKLSPFIPLLRLLIPEETIPSAVSFPNDTPAALAASRPTPMYLPLSIPLFGPT
jgi:hypothetical protein